MNILLLLILTHASSFEVKTFQQDISHFRSTANGKFNQTYIIDDRFSNGDPNSTVVIQISDLWKLNTESPFFSTTTKIAELTNSTLLTIENRYFGNSRPFDVYSPENMSYLSINEIMADVISIVNSLFPNSSHNFVIGGGDAGAIASFLRTKYPQYISSSWSSLSPLLFQTTFADYDYNIIYRLYKRDQSCFEQIQNLIYDLNKSISFGDYSTRSASLSYFGLPPTINDSTAFYLISEFFGELDKINEDTHYMDKICDELQLTPRVYGAYFNSTLEYLKLTQTEIDPTFLNETDLTDNQKNVKSTWHLRCFDLGRFHVPPPQGTAHSIFFRSPLVDSKFYENICQNLFGKSKIGDFSLYNIEYNGNSPQISNAIFTVDPYGAYNSLMANVKSDSYNELYIEQMNYSLINQDLMDKKFNETAQITDAREKLISHAVKWIQAQNNKKMCVHGTWYNNKCICESEYNGEYCSERERSKKLFKNVSAVAIIVPTFILIVASVILWNTLLVYDGNYRLNSFRNEIMF
ncbi:Clan SC, family S28, unassigned serine peptidase [Histomonas meleagridis]|uniref:Clan SC, family S28, unassigned serine peptidase n=1 Tax=Histomonas meleagridis TaxID=135588 RepID=UPI00355A6701|nr:Clan SC, family S28, unassigned serine peptidase [Histomonas meleagridis]KAH0804809.1 Clan SC, family S28, unassigned serine peptidase [Histomonas meleagridis]